MPNLNILILSVFPSFPFEDRKKLKKENDEVSPELSVSQFYETIRNSNLR
jgi:hypothetical protein